MPKSITTPAPRPKIDANALEAMAREHPDEKFLKGSGVLKLLEAIRQLEAENRALKQQKQSTPQGDHSWCPTPPSVNKVLATSAGGLYKRLLESEEVAGMLHMHVPGLFRVCKPLAYNLHANDQFLLALASASSDSLPLDELRRIKAMLAANPRDVFQRIYAGAGIPPPLNV